ncbi:unnamed protein product [Tenebrio molitor]|nr:unnamed protein product [Tenebrio molitor]
MELQHPETISSNKLRKQIATVMQILNLTKDEAKQFANFMGHTEKTHNEYTNQMNILRLPVDIYQTAKVSKILTLMEKGTLPVQYKGKALADINFDFNSEFAQEEDLEIQP